MGCWGGCILGWFTGVWPLIVATVHARCNNSLLVPLPLFHGCCVYNDFAALWHDEMAISCEVGAEGSVIYWVHFCNVPTFFYLSMMALVGGQFSFVFLCCAKFHACKSKMDIVVMSIFGSGMQCRCSLAWPFVAVCVLSC